VRVAQSGADAIQRVVDEVPGTDVSKVTREFLMVAVTTPAVRQAVVRQLKQRQGIE
jgi:hypothetical protein